MLPSLLYVVLIFISSVVALSTPQYSPSQFNLSQTHEPGCNGIYYGWPDAEQRASCHEAFAILSRFSDTPDGKPQFFRARGLVSGDDRVLPWFFSSCKLEPLSL